MSARLRRRIAFVVLTLLAFAQVNVALAGCFMANSADMATPCDSCDAAPAVAPDQISNVCVVHCTSDLQLTAALTPLVLDAIEIPIFVVLRFESPPPPRLALDGPPVAAPPRRILLHSFLV